MVTRNTSISRRTLVAGAGAGAGFLSISVASADEARCKPTLIDAGQAASPEIWISGFALQTATYAVPIVAMYNLRQATSFGPHAKAHPNQMARVENITNPAIAEQLGYVTPNVNVIYGFGFMDLGQQPVILSAPNSEGRYYMIEICDMWTNAFAYVGGVATGYNGGTFALVGPDWQGQLPAGVRRIDCPTRWVEVQPRVHVKNASDLAGAQKVLRAITVTGLAQHAGETAPAPVSYHYETPKIDPKVASSRMRFLDPLQFWEIFSAAMNENPPPQSQIEAVLPQFALLGIELGKAWRRESVPLPMLDAMAWAAERIGTMMMSLVQIVSRTSNGWTMPHAKYGLPGADYPLRGYAAVVGLTANTPVEAIYYRSVTDGTGRPLSGANRYNLTFKASMECIRAIPPGFWSISAYDSATGFTIPNAIDRYALGSDNELKRNADGSFTLYLQHDNPGPGRESNWLPISAGSFYLIIRVYPPVPEVVAQLKNPATFQGPPPIIRE